MGFTDLFGGVPRQKQNMFLALLLVLVVSSPTNQLSSALSQNQKTKSSMLQSIAATVNRTIQIVENSVSISTSMKNEVLSRSHNGALDVCIELFEDTIIDLEAALSDLHALNTPAKYHHLQTLFSAAKTNQDTCGDGFYESQEKIPKQIEKKLKKISRLLSNCLGMLQKIPNRQVFHGYEEMAGDFPRWVTKTDRRLLKVSTNANEYNFDLVVAQDGSGNFTTINQAVEAAPKLSTKRFIIYIKAGIYVENVEVIEKKQMVMFIGDGIGKTVVTSNRSVGGDHLQTFATATVAVVGKLFIARDMTFENSAGPDKEQAVALRSGADSAFYRCSFLGYQDTLYVHSHLQFYKNCDVYGTVDFIFGNAKVVFQDCNLFARKPNPGQQNTFTAQGSGVADEKTAISIQNCNVTAAPDLVPFKSTVETYLGRPWGEFSRTIYIRSFLDDVVHPSGWLEWDDDFALKTLTYREFENKGPGANTTGRVKWPGYKAINSSSEANQYTVASLIKGNEWIPGDIPFYPGLDD